MAAPLILCIKEDQRSVMRHLLSEGKKTSEIGGKWRFSVSVTV